MRLRIVLLFLFLPLALNAQYGQTWQNGVTDLTGYEPTTNLWKSLGSANCTKGISIGVDGTLLCDDSSGHIWSFVVSTQTWDQNAFGQMGNGVGQVAVRDATDVYELGSLGLQESACQAQGHGAMSVAVWHGPNYSNYTALNGCLTQLSVGADGTLVGTNAAYPGLAYKSTDGGNTWTQISGGTVGPNLTYVSAAGSATMCGTNGAQVFVLDSGGLFNLLPNQPNNADAGIYGCGYEHDLNGQADSVYAWGASTVGVQRYDINSAGHWASVIGLSTVHEIATAGKGVLFGLDASGHPYHLNVYGAYLGLTITGSDVNGCGAAGCAGALHRVTTEVEFPHNVTSTGQTQQAYDPSANVNQTSFATSATCDPLFGSPNDPECTPTVATGTVFCTKLLDNIFQTEIPTLNLPKSIDGRGFDGSISYFGYTRTPSGATESAACGMSQNACAPKTAPTCPTTKKTYTQNVKCTGNGPLQCTQTRLEADLLTYGCESFEIAYGGAWRIQQEYVIANGQVLCSNVLRFFGGRGAFPVKCQ